MLNGSTTSFLVALTLALAVLAALTFWWLRRRRARPASDDSDPDRIDTLAAWPPEATRILTTAERVAYITLLRALPGHMVLAQVPLSRFLKVPRRQSYAEWLRRVGNQCVDLVVCDMASQVIAVIDVQPPPSQASDRVRHRSARMSRSLKAAGVAWHVWTEGELPSADQARDLILPRPLDASNPAPAEAPDWHDTVQPARPAASPFDDSKRDSSQDEFIEMQEPPPSTWFDDLDSGRAPLLPPKR